MSFMNQPCKPYRNFHLVNTLLIIMFAYSSVTYTFLPSFTMDSFAQLNAALGGGELILPDRTSDFWRLLGCGNVVALFLCCVLLSINLKKHYAVIYPLLLMKGFVGFSWLYIFLKDPSVPFFGLAAGADVLTFFAILFVHPKARRAINQVDGSVLRPSLR